MKARLQQLLDYKKLSPSRFAEIVGVQRSAVSHIISGRNNPSLLFIGKILNKFSDIDAEWLITGKGNMLKNQNFVINEIPENEMPSLFEYNNSILEDKKNEFEHLDEIVEKQNDNNFNTIENKIDNNDSEIVNNNKKSITRIVILQNDGTFKDYLPE